MRKNEEQTFDKACGICPGAQVRREAALGSTEHTFGLPALAVFFLGELLLQFTTVGTARHRVGVTSSVDRNNRLSNPPLLAAAAMMFFGIVSAIGHEPSNPNPAHRLGHDGQESWRIVAGPATHQRRQDKVATMVNDRGNFGPPAMGGAAPWTRFTIEKVAADVMIFQSRGIDGGLAGRGEQLEFSSMFDDFS